MISLSIKILLLITNEYIAIKILPLKINVFNISLKKGNLKSSVANDYVNIEI